MHDLDSAATVETGLRRADAGYGALHVGFSLATLSRGMLGGGETYVRGLLSAFRDGAGPARTTVITNPTSFAAYSDLAGEAVAFSLLEGFDPNGTAFRRVWHLGRASLRPAALASRLPRDLDLVHYPVVVPLPRAPLPRVITLQDVRHLAMPEQFTRAQRAYRRMAYDEAARRADLVITGSAHSRAAILETLRVDPDRVVVIHHGLNHTRFQSGVLENDEQVLASLGLTPPFVVYPAALWPHKNHIRLFEAMRRLRDTGLTLILTGETYGGWPPLAGQAERLGIADAVRHLGYQPPDVLPVLYRHAEALVYPTLYEGFGIPPLEAMACGCACVLPPGGAVGEVTGGIGELADPYDPDSLAAAVRRLLGDRGRRAELAQLGLAHCKPFTWLRSAEQHARAYARVAQTPLDSKRTAA